MRIRRVRKVTLLGLAVCLAGAGAVVAPTKAACDASGCSFVNYGIPTWVSGCVSSGGAGCYDCEHSGSGGTTRCYESASGDQIVCYDYQG